MKKIGTILALSLLASVPAFASDRDNERDEIVVSYDEARGEYVVIAGDKKDERDGKKGEKAEPPMNTSSDWWGSCNLVTGICYKN
ncbi:hypothetical protein [Novilysobacter spongiicola]|uniref:Uncharacterized protein n=1 Tax=Lysobacter spongiicola DSM 21749 TaxID=1122188 RepID=A0A1T4MYU0_9GAMM|nr:hypothetical protein [Lysobacter spongiicola]SJZ72071.1 hypothetical protein SAMN02745674_00652 [Lysobacter spongiicola DSM 21749]